MSDVPAHALSSASPEEERASDHLDPALLREFRRAWAIHEAWFQAGHPSVEEYAWPVPGTLQVAEEGCEAYMAYRDYIAAFVMAVDGFGEMLRDLNAVVTHVRRRAPDEPRRLFSQAAAPDAAFHAQWDNLFVPDVEWPGLTHDSLSAYARKYEVQWPLRILACLRGLVDTGTYDATLARFRDRAGRLKKGVIANYVASGFAQYPALRDALRLAYSARLRNMIGHNEYVLAAGVVRSIDGTYSQSKAEVWRRIQALMAVQNALVWLESTARHDVSALAARGVIGLGWVPLEEDLVPRLVVLQLAAFRQYDPNAEWLDAAVLEVRAERVDTKLGAARSHGGPIPPSLVPVIDRVRETQALVCEVIGVVPCLHAEGFEHTVYCLPTGRFCEFGDPAIGVVPATVVDVAPGEPTTAT